MGGKFFLRHSVYIGQVVNWHIHCRYWRC